MCLSKRAVRSCVPTDRKHFVREKVQFVMQYEANVIEGTRYLDKTWMPCLNNLGTYLIFWIFFYENTLVIPHSEWFDYKYDLIFCL